MFYLVKIIDSIAWPAVVVFLSICFKKDLRDFFQRITFFKFKGIEAELEKRISEAEQDARSIKMGNNLGKNENKYTQKYRQLFNISNRSQRDAIIVGWIEIEDAIFETAEKCGIKSLRNNSRELFFKLTEEGYISKHALPMFNTLREIRNQAAHARSFNFSPDLLERYLDLCVRLSLWVQSSQKHKK